jgi:hypothetical protein
MPYLSIYAELRPADSITDEVTRHAMRRQAAEIEVYIRSQFLAIAARHTSPDVAGRIVNDIAVFVSQNVLAFYPPEISNQPLPDGSD